MQFPWYKRLLSHFTEQSIEVVRSDVNDLLHVSLVRGRLQLSTKNAIYSFDDLYDNFRSAFEKIRWDTWTGEETLLLGLGLGSIPSMLERVFKQDMRYTAVDLDEQVIHLANKYVLNDLRSPVTSYTADAALFVTQDTGEYDLICVDVFIDDDIPDTLKSTEFLEVAKEMLKPGGILMFNVLSRTKEDVRLAKEFKTQFLEVFPDGGHINTRGNWVLVNSAEFFRPGSVI